MYSREVTADSQFASVKSRRYYGSTIAPVLSVESQTMSHADPAEPNPKSSSAADSMKDRIREAIQSGEQLTERVRDIVVGVFQGKSGATVAARSAVNSLMAAATEIADRSAPQGADSILRRVVDGLTDGLKAVAQSSQYALQEASSRGQRFATEDLDRVRQDLQGISEILMDTMKHFSGRATAEAGSAVRDLRTHTERAVSTVTPAVKASLDAVIQHPVQTVGEAASTAIRGGQLTAGALLGAMSDLLGNAASLLDPGRRSEASAADRSSPAKSADLPS